MVKILGDRITGEESGAAGEDFCHERLEPGTIGVGDLKGAEGGV